MVEFLKTYSFIVGALSGSLAAYLLGLLVSHLRREKRWLGFSVSSRNVVIANHSKVKIEFEGKEIQRLDSHTINFRNIGNRPLSKLPVKIQLVGSGSIVESELNAPQGSEFKTEADSEGSLTILIDLLNPGEAFSFGLTVADTKMSKIQIIARAEYLELKELDSQKSTAELIDILVGDSVFGKLLIEVNNMSKIVK